MTNDQQQRPRSSPAVWLALTVLLLPFAYVLSTGPAVWLHNHGYIPGEVGWIYLPLEYINDNVQFVESFFNWYIALWGK